MADSFEEDGLVTEEEEELMLEKKHFMRIVNAFRYYRVHCMSRVNRRLSYVKQMPQHQQNLLAEYTNNMQALESAICHNYSIIQLIIEDVSSIFLNREHNLDKDDANGALLRTASGFDMEKVESTVKQFVRDWCSEGQAERDVCYSSILDSITEYFPDSEWCPRSVRILIPGAGLGRLAFEVAQRGYFSEGNEFSMYMLLASNFILNKCQGIHLHRLYPWVHYFSNSLTSEDRLKSVTFPDVDPSGLPINSAFRMIAGDFLNVYKTPEAWDCVACCFFLDTANNIVDYLETIWRILKPGGYLINFGPLLYHYSDMVNENSIEPSYVELRAIIQNIGFRFLKEKTNIKTTYAGHPYSLLQYEYHCIFFVCQKPNDVMDDHS